MNEMVSARADGAEVERLREEVSALRALVAALEGRSAAEEAALETERIAATRELNDAQAEIRRNALPASAVARSSPEVRRAYGVAKQRKEDIEVRIAAINTKLRALRVARTSPDVVVAALRAKNVALRAIIGPLRARVAELEPPTCARE